MAKIKYYLKDPQSDQDTLIYLMFRYKRKTLKYSTGESINPKFWNPKSQRAKETSKFAEYPELNHFLDKLGERTTNIFRSYKADGIIPDPRKLREALKDSYNENVSASNFEELFEEFVESKKIIYAKTTIVKYREMMDSLKAYVKKSRMVLSFDNIDLQFYEKFTNYLISDLKLVNNTITKQIKTLKTFLNWAADHGYNLNHDFKKFKVSYSEADTIALTYKELMAILELDLKENKSMERVRDTFCFGCFTGLRFGDIKHLKKDNIQGKEIHLNIRKTKETLVIPLNKFALDILKKYNYNLPIFSNAMANIHIKDIGELAKINDPIIRTRHRGSEILQVTLPKHKFLSAHTGRRTFVTLSLELGMRPEIVMSITGHKDYKTFKRYIKLTSKAKMQEMQQVWNKSEKSK
jgi:integrase